MKRILGLVGSLLIALLYVFCQKEAVDAKNILARVDGEVITIEDFRLFYELDPNFGIDSTGYAALRDELHKFIDHKLAFRKAQEEELIENPSFKRAWKWEKKQAMLRQLYREQVEKHIEISEEELRKAFVEYNTELHVRHLFTKDPQQAQELYDQLQNGASIEMLAPQVFRDTLLAESGGDLGWHKAGELDEDFAAVALQLGPNEISKPVQTRWGYHIIQLLGRKDQVILSEAAFNAQRQSLEKRLRRKKSQRLANQYIAWFMQSINPQPVPQNFLLLWRAVVPPAEQEKSTLSFKIAFTNDLIKNALQKLAPHLEEPLIRIQGRKDVSIEEYLNALREIPLSNRPSFRSANQLSNQLGVWIRDELLFQEASRPKLDRHPRVQSEVQEFLEQQSYLFYLQQEVEKIEVPQFVKDYFEKKDRSVIQAHPNLARFHTLQEWIWARAEKQLHQRLKPMDARIEIDYQKLKEESEKIDWQGRVRMFVIRKPS